MKTWWKNLAIREKQIVSLGSIALLAFLIYGIVFSPLSNAVENLRQKIRANQTLLAWMQATDKQIALLGNTTAKSSVQSSVSLLNLIQVDISSRPFNKNVTQLQQAENDSVQLTLQKVNFDSLIKWLLTLTQHHHLLITEMSMQPTGSPGMVNAGLKLQIS